MHQEQKHQEICYKQLKHMTTLENLISLSGKLHILENVVSSARGWIGSPLGNKTPPYMDATKKDFFPAFSCSLDPLINVFSWFFKNIVVVYTSNWEALGMLNLGCIFFNHT